MSLNGLDTPVIQDAYQSAIAEAGGWFLLKYSSRDSVELFARGKAGVNEARNAIAEYKDASPLYGLIIYRRRKVCIKYIPEGTSRLLQARTAVHFQDISEHFAPYETLLEITSADGLNDTSLASSFPLHTASPSASSNRLHEISEDGEDSGAVPRTRPTIQHTSTGNIFGTQRYKMERRVEQIMRTDRPTPSIQVTRDSSNTLLSPHSSPISTPQKTSISQFLVREDSGQRSITSLGSQHSMGSMTDYDASNKSAETIPKRVESLPSQAALSPTLPAIQIDEASPPTHQDVDDNAVERSQDTLDRQPSTSPETRNERPSLSKEPSKGDLRQPEDDPYDFSRFDVKPKVKLGPRPIAAGEWTKRPTAASTAALPASYRQATKKQEPIRPMSQNPTASRMAVPAAFPAPPPIPAAPEYNPRPLSRGSIKSLPSHKSTTMTSDKVRLMKAVELRKKQLRKSNTQQQAFASAGDAVPPEVPSIPKAHATESGKTTSAGKDVMDSARDDQTPTKKADSGIEMGYERHEKQEEDGSAEGQQSASVIQPSAETATLAGAERSPSKQPEEPPLTRFPSRQSLTKASHETQAHEPVSEEPTVSMDMLDNTSSPLASLQHEINFDSPTLGRTMGMSSPGLTATHDPSSGLGHATSPELPQVEQSRTETKQELESSPENDNPDAPQSPRLQNKELAKRRRGFVEPLHFESHPEGDFTSDDEFLEELQSATFQDAKPITMARSPMAPTFARAPSANSTHSDSVRSVQIAHRASSNALDAHGDSPSRRSPEPRRQPSARSISSSTYQDPNSEVNRVPSPPAIPRRYQTYSPEPPVSQPSMSESLAQSTWRDRKTSVRGPPKPRRGSSNSIGRHSGRLSGHASPGHYSTQEAESAPIYNVQHEPASNRESVSVTARIVRPSVDGDDRARSNGSLQQSQLVINHKRASASATPASVNKELPQINTNPSVPLPRTSSTASMTTGSSGMSPVMTRASTEFRTLHSSNRKSFARLRQPAATPFSSSNTEEMPPPPPASHINNARNSAPPPSNDDNAAISREGSRTSRFFKRMSNLGSSGNSKRRSGVQQSQTPFSPSAAASQADAVSLRGRNASVGHSDKSDMPPAVVVGNLNVQFPDSLLWKRRIVEIDEAGNLVFSVNTTNDANRKSGLATTKSFHLTDFRLPYTPDLDRQELPHSVMLDFGDASGTGIPGGTVQAACEDGMTQRQVLHVLRTYWRAWNGVA